MRGSRGHTPHRVALGFGVGQQVAGPEQAFVMHQLVIERESGEVEVAVLVAAAGEMIAAGLELVCQSGQQIRAFVERDLPAAPV